MQTKAARLLDNLFSTAKQVDLTVPDTKDITIDFAANPSDLSKFYDQLRDVKQFHRLNPLITTTAHLDHLLELEVTEEELDVVFSGEEMFGKYLDLTTLHSQYLSLKNVKKLKYTQYLEQFQQSETIPKQTRMTKEYQTYINDLKAYLEGYLRRAQPLLDFLKFKQEHVKIFNAENGQQNGSNGTLTPAQRQAKMLALSEFLVKSYATHLEKTITETKEYATSKAVMTEKERLELIEAAPSTTMDAKAGTTTAKAAESENEEEEEERIHNPLNLPLGWDGKPIPYWLYKLHGLGVEYTCEICGNFTYFGRKNFDKHFQEWRHAHGMRSLGIPNTKHFQDVTLIQDAVQCMFYPRSSSLHSLTI